jgi:hypothetical protein
MNQSTTLRRTLAVTVLSVVFGIGVPSMARAACQHGVSTFKTCESPRRTCAANGDCDDGLPCTDDVCDTVNLSNVTDCTIILTHADTCGDNTKITEAFDVQDVGGDDVRVPAVGNLPIDAINGNAVCCAGPVLPCFVAPAGAVGSISNATSGCGILNLPGSATVGSVEFRQNTYVIQANDPNPLPDQGTFRAQDLCNASVSGCSMAVNTVQFTAATDLVPGCLNPPSPESTPCDDNDGNLCTNAGCDTAGTCEQDHIVTTCPGDACSGQCDPLSGLCAPVEDSSPCPDTDDNPCTMSGCEAGLCVQEHILPDSTPCGDTDDLACTTAGCDAAGECDQSHIDTCPPPLRHFQCYEMPREPFTVITGVTANDMFGPSTVTVVRPKRLCNPANKNGEDPGAESDIHHLTGYIIKQDTPKFQHRNVQVVNQIGTIVVEVAKPDYLKVPTAKSKVSSPPALPSAVIDHFKCYRARKAKQRAAGIAVLDQFGSLTLDIKKPYRLCTAVNKNGEGILDPAANLMCYKIRQTSSPTFRGFAPLYINNQFEVSTIATDHLRELCVPSTVTILP